MIVQCSDCHASYSVDDSKVTNKKFGFACPKCGANVVIDNREQHAADDILAGFSDDLSGSDAAEFQDSDTADTPPETSSVRSTTEASDDFVDFDLSSDDEELLRRVETAGPAGGETPIVSKDDESISLDDFDSTEGLDLDLLDTPSAASTRTSTPDLDIDSIIASEQTESLSSRSVAVNARKTDFESSHVDQDDFRPLEEDLVLDDLDNINTSESNFSSGPDSLDLNRSIKSEDILNETPEDADESITIDLDSLDIQLDESSPSVSTGAQPPDNDFFHEEPDKISVLPSDVTASGDDEQDITLDLDSLDITLDEVEEFKEGVSLDDDDERLTLDDAGISIDQLEAVEEHGSEAEEDLKLSIDDINPDLSIDALEVSDSSIINEINSDDMPEIDFDRLESEPDISNPSLLSTGAMIAATTSVVSGSEENYLDIETRESFDKYRHDVESYGDDGTDTVPRGAINFSIDYSLSHSRIGAILRMLGVYIIALIPHFLTLFIYSFLSQILGLLNWIIIVFTGRYIEDFIAIQEKTLRYLLSIAACQTAAVDEMPLYGGREDIDYALQFNVIYPSKPSRILAFLRISVIGIHIILIPHLILLTLLTFGSLIITFAGIISIIAIRRWPNILFDFIVRYFRYVANVIAYMIGLVDKYPTFRFE